jgi:hypothetical protein
MVAGEIGSFAEGNEMYTGGSAASGSQGVGESALVALVRKDPQLALRKSQFIRRVGAGRGRDTVWWIKAAWRREWNARRAPTVSHSGEPWKNAWVGLTWPKESGISLCEGTLNLAAGAIQA